MKSVEATEIVMDLASQQWGLVTTAQATAEGVSSVLLGRLVNRAVLTRVRFGVYAVESTPWSPATEIRAQWLALEPSILAADRLEDPTPVVVSHESAAALHKIGDLDSHGVHFTVPSRRQTRQQEVVFHIADVSPQGWSVVDGLPVTTPLRTVVDLARAGHEPGHLTDMVATIVDRRLATREEVSTALVEIANYLGIVPENATGVHAWLEEQFPTPQTSSEERWARQFATALAPLQEQIQEIVERLHPSLPSTDLSWATLQSPEVQKMFAEAAAKMREGFASSLPPELRALTLPHLIDIQGKSPVDSTPPHGKEGSPSLRREESNRDGGEEIDENHDTDMQKDHG